MDNKVFVYGTLKQGNRTRGMQHFGGEAEFMGNAVTSDAAYSMYDLGAFPAVVLGGKNKISGEVFKVDDDVLSVLDQIEGYPEFYQRKEIKTTLGTAWIYHIPDIQYYNGEKLEPGKDNVIVWSKK